MKKQIINMCALGVTSLLAFAPLAGNAYYCKGNNQSCSRLSYVHAATTNNANNVLETLNIKAKSCVLMEKSTGEILLQRDPESSYPMASMTKMMTLLLVMEEIEKGNINLHQTTRISEFAASQEGSECFLDANKEYLVKELIKSVVVASANDSTVALAELVSGSEEMFAKRMNDKASMLGMTRTHFINSTGLDAKGHVSSARDMCILMRELSKHEGLREYSHVWMYDMEHAGGRVTNLTNTNRLVKTNPDVKLAKTGHTDGAGYCITVLGEKDGMEIIACVMGENDSKERFDDASKLLNYAFSNYDVKVLARKDEPISTIKVKGGLQQEVSVCPKQDVKILQKKGENSQTQKIIDIPQQVSAPIASGLVVGKVTFLTDNEEISVELVVKDEVKQKKLLDIAKELLSPLD